MDVVENMRKQLKEFQTLKESLDKQEIELFEKRETCNAERVEFDKKYADIMDNPVRQEQKDEEEKPLLQKEEELISAEKELKESRNKMDSDFNEFIFKSKEDVAKEEERIAGEKGKLRSGLEQDSIEELQERKNKLSQYSVEKLEARKTKLESDKAMYEKRLQEWEENNIDPNDALYIRLKSNLLPNVETELANITQEIAKAPEIEEQLANINKEIEEYKTTEEISKDWDSLNGDIVKLADIMGVLNNLHTMEYKMEELDKTLGTEQVKEQETENDKGSEVKSNVEVKNEQDFDKESDKIELNFDEIKELEEKNIDPNDVRKLLEQIEDNETYNNQYSEKEEIIIKGIEIGTNGVKIEFEGEKLEPIVRPFSEIKNVYKNKGEYLNNEDIQKGLDPLIMYALVEAEKQGMSGGQINQIRELYKKAFYDDKTVEDNRLQNLITYNRTDLDYLKPANLFKLITRHKEYKQMREYANLAQEKEAATIKSDEKGPVRNFFGNLFNRNNTKMFENKEKPQLSSGLDKKDEKEMFISGLKFNSKEEKSSEYVEKNSSSQVSISEEENVEEK